MSDYDDDDGGSSSSSSSSSGLSSFRKSRAGKATAAAGRGLSEAGSDMISTARDQAASSIHAVQYHRGGKVRKTGIARLKKGERVIPKGKVKKVDRMMKKRGMRKTGGRR